MEKSINKDNVILIIALGLGVAMVFGVNRLFGGNKTQNKQALKDWTNRTAGDPRASLYMDLAKKFKTALLEGPMWGAVDDETLVYETIAKFKDNRDAIEVAAAFGTLTGQDLPSKISMDFDSAERQKVRDLLNAKNITVWQI